MDKCQTAALAWNGMLIEDFRLSCMNLKAKSNLDCYFLDDRIGGFTDYDCMEVTAFKKSLEVYFGEDLDGALQKATDDPKANFNWNKPQSLCLSAAMISLSSHSSRVINSCQSWNNTEPILTNEISGFTYSDYSGGNSTTNTTDIPYDNSKCAGNDQKTCWKNGCCFYKIFLSQFEIFEEVCVNMDAYVYYLIPDQVKALNQANFTGIDDDTQITKENFCKVLETDQNGGDYIESCDCVGEKADSSFGSILGLENVFQILSLASFIVLTLISS